MQAHACGLHCRVIDFIVNKVAIFTFPIIPHSPRLFLPFLSRWRLFLDWISDRVSKGEPLE